MVDLNAQFRSVFGAPPGDVKQFVKQLGNARLMLIEQSDVLEEEAQYVRENLNRDRMYEEIMAVYASSPGSIILPSTGT